MKIIFFGTPVFAAETLRTLLDHRLNVVAVVTKPDKPVGRSGKPKPSAVKQFVMQDHPHIPLFQPQKASTDEFIEILNAFEADLFVVVAYGEIINQKLLDQPKIACLNVHASLLPKYRGAAPIQRALIDGEKETGVTIMHMVRKLDAGPMIRQVKVKIGQNTSFSELHDCLQKSGAHLLIDVLKDMEKAPLPEIEQNESEVTYAQKIEPHSCEIDWHRPAKELHNLIRGVSPFPGAWCWMSIRGEKKRLKILLSRVVLGYSETPGHFLIFGDDGIIVSTGKEALRLLQVKPEGKRAMTGEEFARGYAAEDIILFGKGELGG